MSEMWVDASGRMISAAAPNGISVMRTAFEIAFENWRLDQTSPPQPAASPPGEGKKR
jgi:hypothetical protein